jgi:hypothetical protein
VQTHTHTWKCCCCCCNLGHWTKKKKKIIQNGRRWQISSTCYYSDYYCDEKHSMAPPSHHRVESCADVIFFSVCCWPADLLLCRREMEESLVRSTGGHVLYIAASAWKESKRHSVVSLLKVWIDHNRRPFSTARLTVSTHTHTHSTGTG